MSLEIKIGKILMQKLCMPNIQPEIFVFVSCLYCKRQWNIICIRTFLNDKQLDFKKLPKIFKLTDLNKVLVLIHK